MSKLICSIEGKKCYVLQACARAVGICARKHLNLVLLKLEKLVKEELTRKSSRLLGFMKDMKHEGEVERMRLTLLLCYGELALGAPSCELLPHLEQGIAQWVLQQLQTAKVRTVEMQEVVDFEFYLYFVQSVFAGWLILVVGLLNQLAVCGPLMYFLWPASLVAKYPTNG